MNRVLVTGGTGLIGRHSVARLVELGFEVHAIARRPPPGRSPVCWQEGNLLDPGVPERLMEQVKPTHLLHLAWYTAPGTFWSSSENRQWLDTSIQLFRAFERAGGLRLIAVGTCAEYDWSEGVCNEFQTPCNPQTLYGRTKLAAATYLNVLSSGSLSTAWARLFFLYGPEANLSRMPQVVISGLLRGEPVACTQGSQQRDFLFAADAADAIVKLMCSSVTGPVNICSGQAVSIEQLARHAASLIGRPELLQFGAIAPNSDEPPLIVGDPNRLNLEVGWTPPQTLESGLAQTIDGISRLGNL